MHPTRAPLNTEAYHAQVATAAAFIRGRLATRPDVAVILGTGQGVLPEGLTIDGVMAYAEIPNFPATTVTGHAGRLVHGRVGRRECLVLQGRVHWYEGYDTLTVTLPVRVMAELGVTMLIITNTAGGLNPALQAGDLMVINDHLNFIGANPLRGANREAWGPRFPDLTQAYSTRLMAIAQEAAQDLGLRLPSGVYAAVPGPSLETPAETRFLRQCGADAVGMSTVPEVIVAVHAGLEVLALSIIANVNDPDHMQPVLLDEVIARVKEAEGRSRRLLSAIIESSARDQSPSNSVSEKT